MIAAGRTSKSIAGELGISVWTVSSYVRRLFGKFGVDSRAALVYKYFAALALRLSAEGDAPVARESEEPADAGAAPSGGRLGGRVVGYEAARLR